MSLRSLVASRARKISRRELCFAGFGREKMPGHIYDTYIRSTTHQATYVGAARVNLTYKQWVWVGYPRPSYGGSDNSSLVLKS